MHRKWFNLVLIVYLIVCAAIISLLMAFILTSIQPKFGGQFFQIDDAYYVTADPSMVEQRFLVEKPSNGFRVFLLGGSQAMGSPYVHQKFTLMDELGGMLEMPNEGGIAT